MRHCIKKLLGSVRLPLIPWYNGLKKVLRHSGGFEAAGVRLMTITAIISPYSAGIDNGPMRPLFQTATSSHRNSVRSVRAVSCKWQFI